MKKLLLDLVYGVLALAGLVGLVLVLMLLHIFIFKPIELGGLLVPLYAASLFVWVTPVLGIIGLGRIVRIMRGHNDQA